MEVLMVSKSREYFLIMIAHNKYRNSVEQYPVQYAVTVTVVRSFNNRDMESIYNKDYQEHIIK